MTRLEAVAVARNEAQAEVICGLLRDAGIPCMQRITDLGFGSGGEVPTGGGGVREVLVRAEAREQARELLAAMTKDAP